MLNSPDNYTEAGRRAAQARNQNDEQRAAAHAGHFRQMRNAERPEDREKVTELFRAAYADARHI